MASVLRGAQIHHPAFLINFSRLQPADHETMRSSEKGPMSRMARELS